MFRKTLLSLIILTSFVSSTVLTDIGFSFSAQVEAEWNLEKINSTTLCIYNSDISKKTKLYIERITVDTISVFKDEECAQMYFLSNYAVANQYGIVQYFDSTTSIRQGTLRAYEMYAYYRDAVNGTNQWWAEYSRWCAKDNYVFQLTVLGDTADVNRNIMRYKNMLDGIQVLPPPTKINRPLLHRFAQQQTSKAVYVYDLFGRKINNNFAPKRNAATGCLVAPMSLTIKLR